jgi:hypothetical protein
LGYRLSAAVHVDRYNLPNGDVLQVISWEEHETYDLHQVDATGLRSRRHWFDVDELTKECIKIELLKNPFSNLTPDGEPQS